MKRRRKRGKIGGRIGGMTFAARAAARVYITVKTVDLENERLGKPISEAKQRNRVVKRLGRAS